MATVLGILVLLGLSVASPNVDTVEYQLIELDSPVDNIVFCGSESEVMLALTQKHSVYRSENKGFSWRQLQSILEREGSVHVEEGRSMGQVNSIRLSPVDKRMVVMLGSKGINWFSDDCGKSIWALNYGKPIYDFQFHPIKRDWGLAASWTACSDFQSDSCELYKELFVTKNMKDWTFVTDYVVQFSWAQDSLEPHLQRRIPDDRIYVTHIPNASGHQYIQGWTHKVDLIRSDDYFQTKVTLVPRGNKFIISGKYVLVAQVIDESSSEVQLLVSNERNLETFEKAELPMKRLADHSFTLLDTSEGSLFLHVNHLGLKAQYGNVYISDSSGRRFSASLLRVAQGSDGTCDFDKLYSLEGIYLANVYDKEFANDLNRKAKSTKGQKASKEVEEQTLLKTVITFDKGSIWRQIQTPERDSSGKRVTCEDENCSLHLHSLSNKQFSPIYSTENAVGIVLGTGNIGSYLSTREDEINTYLSRDGGLTWSEVRKGSHIYEIGDHGALIVMAENQKATDTVFYTWNEGLTWETLRIADKPLEIVNIIISQGATSQNFLVLANRGAKGVVIAVDFSSLHEPQCKNIEKAGTDESDYELWSPNDGRAGSKCLMGRTVLYQRRKQEAECYNGEELERAALRENCVCTEEDYECDVGYFREENAPCRPIPDSEPPQDKCLPGDEFYEIPTGYRRVAGNTCVGGVADKYDPMRVACSSSSASMTYFLLFLFGVVAVGYVVSTQMETVKGYYGKIVKAYREPKYTRNFGSLPDTVDDDMVIRESSDAVPLRDEPQAQDFNPRE